MARETIKVETIATHKAGTLVLAPESDGSLVLKDTDDAGAVVFRGSPDGFRVFVATIVALANEALPRERKPRTRKPGPKAAKAPAAT